MSRRRANAERDDSLDLLLDTVTNVFGGVMFLTLLAALLVLSGGRAAVAEPEFDLPQVIHDQERLAFSFLEAVKRGDPGMIQRGEKTRFALEAG